MKRVNPYAGAALLIAGWATTAAQATLLADPNDPRSWQGATVGTFAQLYYGSDTPATRQQVINNQLLDDGVFSGGTYQPATLMPTPWALANPSVGQSLDLTGTGSYDYVITGGDVFTAANSVDNLWFQSSGTVGDTVYDFGFDATHAAVFPVIDHGPLPNEAIESTIYLSNDLQTWTQAVVERVWLEGSDPNTGILWDGFTYVVGTGTSATFRYASVIHGGPGALQDDGDNEFNALMGLPNVPEPSALALLGVLALASGRRR